MSHVFNLTLIVSSPLPTYFFFYFFNATPTTEIYTLSLHDALPISMVRCARHCSANAPMHAGQACIGALRSEEHTSELQSPCNLVCRLLLEKKKLHISGRTATKTDSNQRYFRM